MRGIHLRLAGGDNGITGDKLGEDTTSGLNTESQGADIDQNYILSTSLTREDTTLNGSTIRNSLIRVDTLGRLLATEELLQELLNLGDTSRTADEDNL